MSWAIFRFHSMPKKKLFSVLGETSLFKKSDPFTNWNVCFLRKSQIAYFLFQKRRTGVHDSLFTSLFAQFWFISLFHQEGPQILSKSVQHPFRIEFIWQTEPMFDRGKKRSGSIGWIHEKRSVGLAAVWFKRLTVLLALIAAISGTFAGSKLHDCCCFSICFFCVVRLHTEPAGIRVVQLPLPTLTIEITRLITLH